ncbi:hypothetical protein NQZ68_026326 [Dissostichus eleginoides]|nr:hypothetical protein NQZ68_026326 [Dissostichus eleginoides]
MLAGCWQVEEQWCWQVEEQWCWQVEEQGCYRWRSRDVGWVLAGGGAGMLQVEEQGCWLVLAGGGAMHDGSLLESA